MGLCDRFQALRGLLDDAVAQYGANPFAVKMDRVLSPTEAIISGRPTILAGTNNYLGLTFNEECKAAAIEAVTSEGTGTTGSPIANGSFALHKNPEDQLARVYRRRHAMIYTTRYQANLAVLSTPGRPRGSTIP